MSVNPAAGLTDPDVYDRLYYRYSYDALGNITQIKEIGPDNTVLDTTDYSYDNQGQLTSAVSTSSGSWSYQYDTYGNLRSWTYLVPGFFSESYAYTYGDSAWIDLLTGLTVTKNGTTTTGSYVYDGSGNPTSYFSPGDLSTWTMSWKNGRELATASNGTHTVSYDYDVNGLRTYKIVDGVRHDYLYASGQLLRESWTENSVTYTLDFAYDHAGRPYLLNVSTSSGGTSQSNVYYYILNLQGDVAELVNTDGEPVAEYCYDPYGGIFNSSGSLANINPLRYRGYYYDAETGFYYLQSRYYDPTLGRFLNADGYASTGQGFLGYNMFAYCGNNPVSSSDPSGEYGGHQPIMVNDGGSSFSSLKILIARELSKGGNYAKEVADVIMSSVDCSVSTIYVSVNDSHAEKIILGNESLGEALSNSNTISHLFDTGIDYCINLVPNGSTITFGIKCGISLLSEDIDNIPDGYYQVKIYDVIVSEIIDYDETGKRTTRMAHHVYRLYTMLEPLGQSIVNHTEHHEQWGKTAFYES